MREISFSRDFAPSTFRAVLTRIQSDIVKRTILKNTDLDGAPFAQYSDRYAVGNVTLVNTGWMLSHWGQRVKVQNNQIIGVTTPKSRNNPAQNGKKNEYSYYVDMGSDNQPKRHFIGLTEQQEQNLQSEVLDPIFAKLFEGWLQSQFEENSLVSYEQEVRKIIRQSNKAWREAKLLIRMARAQKERKHKIYFGKISGKDAISDRARKMREQYYADRASLAAGRKIK